MIKEYTKEDVISILEFSKDKNNESEEVLLSWVKDRNNRIEEKHNHGLSVVGIFEHPINNKDNKEIGKIIIFNYTGVGGGWHNDIFKMVEEKYFSDSPYFSFIPGDNSTFFYRFFLTGDIFKDENFNEWDMPKKTEDFRVFKQELPNSEFTITYDVSDERVGSEMNNNLRRSNCMYYDDIRHNYTLPAMACIYYIKNIADLKYEPSRLIIEQRIRDRKIKELLK